MKDDKKDECLKRSCIQSVKDFIRSYIIVIDPGHGEEIQKEENGEKIWVYHSGALSSENVVDENGKRYKEAHMVLDIAKKIRMLLKKVSKNNLTVKLTRESDKVKGLGARTRAERTRTAIINKIKAKKCEKTHPIFLSIHLNSNESSLDKNEACNNTYGHEELWAFLEKNNQPIELLLKFKSYGFKDRGLVDGSKNGVLRYGPLCLKELKVTALDGNGNEILICKKPKKNGKKSKDKKDRPKCYKVYIKSEYPKPIITKNSLSEVDFLCNDGMAKLILTTDYGHLAIGVYLCELFCKEDTGCDVYRTA